MKRLFLTLLLISGAVHANPTIWKSGQYGRWLPTLGWELYDGKQYRSATVDPTAGAGIAAPVGSIIVRDNGGLGEFYFKYGAGNTAWSNVLTSTTGWSLTGNAGTLPASNFIGTTDAQDLVFRTNNVEALRLTSAGAIDTTLGAGILHSNASGVISSSAVDLASADVTGTLPVDNGGTERNTLTQHTVLVGDGTNPVQMIGPGTTGQVLKGNTGAAPSFGAVDLTADVTGVLPLANGGTNKNATASNGAVVYSDADSFELSAVGSAGQVLQSNGAAAPTWSTPTYPSASGSAGQILRSDGTNNVYSTATFPNTVAQYSLLYGSAANVWSELLTANTSALVTSATGVPSWVSGAVANRVLRTDGTTISFSQLNLTTDVTGILPLANGGTNKNMTASAGSIAYSDADSLELSGVGIAGQAVLSGGTGAPTFFNPTAGSVLFAGPSGVLAQDNANLFYDDTNNRLGIGTAVPATQLHVSGAMRSDTSLIIQDPGIGTNQWTIQSPTLLADYTLTLPSDDGTPGQFLTTDGNGVTSWTTPASTGNVNNGVAGRVGVYPSNGTTIDDTYTQNGNDISVAIAAHPTLGAARTYTIPEAGADASFVMTQGNQTVSGVKTFDNTAWTRRDESSAATITALDPTPMFVRVTATVTNIQGIDSTGVFDGQMVCIMNDKASGSVLIEHEDASALAANRIRNALGMDTRIFRRQIACFVYDTSNSRWSPMAGFINQRLINTTSTTPSSITAAGGVTLAAGGAYDERQYVVGSGGAVDITAIPQITAGVQDGAEVCLIGTSDTNTVQLDNGDGLVLNGVAVLGQYDQLCLNWDSGSSQWIEKSRNF